MNRSISRLVVLSIAALAAASAMAQSTAPGYSQDYAKQPAHYVSPQERIKQAPLNKGQLPVLGNVVQTSASAANTVAATCSKKGCVPVIGRTADQKYPVYGLEGDLQDLNYMSKQANAVYQPQDLIKRMGYVEAADTKGHGIQCEFICKNAVGQVVGLNPEVKWMETGKPPVQAKR